MSDISRMPAETEAFIKKHFASPDIHILVVDSLLKDMPHPTHYSLKQAKDLIQRLNPKRAFIVGMNCDNFPPHREMNRLLALEDDDNKPKIRLASDGLDIIIDAI